MLCMTEYKDIKSLLNYILSMAMHMCRLHKKIGGFLCKVTIVLCIMHKKNLPDFVQNDVYKAKSYAEWGYRLMTNGFFIQCYAMYRVCDV